MDFTPGIFDILIERGTGRPRRPDESRIRTTLAKQLALYVVLYSPLQMAADLPENYESQPAFQFIRDVAVDWDTTRVLDGKIGDYVVVARKARGQRRTGSSARSPTRRAAHLRRPCRSSPRARSYVAGDLRRRPGRALADQSAAGRDHAPAGDVGVAAPDSCWRRAAVRRSGSGPSTDSGERG